MQATNEDIKVMGRIVSMSTEGIVADAEQIFDDYMTKYVETGKQSDINQYLNLEVSKLEDKVSEMKGTIDGTPSEETDAIPLLWLEGKLV